MLGDAHQLRQVLGNLVRNALVHTPADSPIEVNVGREDGEVRLEVRDHGPGLPTDDPNALFERFWRAEGGRERGKCGAGLGLAIVAGIVGAHGGRVTRGQRRRRRRGVRRHAARRVAASASSQGAPEPAHTAAARCWLT